MFSGLLKTSWFVAPLVNQLGSVCAQPGASQQPLSLEPALQRVVPLPDNSTAPHVFNSLTGLLKQWPNTHHFNGHTIIVGELEANTLLYHGRPDTQSPPPSPEWFAFDPEMSYGILISWGWPVYMHTYRTTRPTKVIYLDGMSAALGEGWLDTQEAFLERHGRRDEKQEDFFFWFDDYGRARRLCEWAKPRGIEGLIRMNTGFEAIWCNLTSPSIQLVSHLNITPPGTPEKNCIPPKVPRPTDRPQGPQPFPCTDGRLSTYAGSFVTEWLRIATRRAFVPQQQIRLSYSSMVSYYHPRLTSLAGAREGQPTSKHRIWANISDEDAISVAEEVEQVLVREAASDLGSHVNWGSVADNVLESWSDRVIELRDILEIATKPDANLTDALEVVKMRSYTPLDSHMEVGSKQNASGWHLFFEKPNVFPAVNALQIPLTANWSAFERCANQATHFVPISSLTSQEALLRVSIETVQTRLCKDFGTIFAESMSVSSAGSFNSSSAALSDAFTSWHDRITSLMTYLEWPTWLRCDEVCDRGSVCTMPVWPFSWPHGGDPRRGGGEVDSEAFKPKCVSLDMRAGSFPGGRGRGGGYPYGGGGGRRGPGRGGRFGKFIDLDLEDRLE